LAAFGSTEQVAMRVNVCFGLDTDVRSSSTWAAL
jgi:hypothetical protein